MEKLFIKNLPVEDEGHPLQWSYEVRNGEYIDSRGIVCKMVGETSCFVLKTSFGEVVHPAPVIIWSDEAVTKTIRTMLDVKRWQWRAKLRESGALAMENSDKSVYTYKG